jgi:hypothetical protein
MQNSTFYVTRLTGDGLTIYIYRHVHEHAYDNGLSASKVQ